MADELLGLNLAGPPDEGPTPEARALAAGLAGGVASLAVAAPLWWFLHAPFLPLRVADAIFAVVPITLVQFAVAFLGPYAKRGAFAGCVAGYLVILALLGVLYRRWRPEPSLASGLAFGAAVWVAACATVVPLAGGGLLGAAWGPNVVLAAGSLLASGLAYGAATGDWPTGRTSTG